MHGGIEIQTHDAAVAAKRRHNLTIVMKVTYYGHSCFAVETAGRTLLFDPFITANELARNIDINQVPADFVLISHGHFDHLADAVAIAKRTGALIVSNYEITVWLGHQGVGRTHPLNHGGGAQFDFGRAKFTPAVHSSGLPDGTYGGNPGGFLVETPDGAFYHSGDTALTYDMKLIGEEGIDLALLPIGDNYTMGPDDALRAVKLIEPKAVIPIHYNTFDLIAQDAQAWAKRVQAETATRAVILKPGETYTL